jgi:hypothetical protein
MESFLALGGAVGLGRGGITHGLGAIGPAPPPPPRPPRPRPAVVRPSSGGSGGGAGGAWQGPTYRPPPWLPQYILYDEQERQEQPVLDFFVGRESAPASPLTDEPSVKDEQVHAPKPAAALAVLGAPVALAPPVVEERPADLAVVHVITVKALADGWVARKVDSRGRVTVVLTAADGTRYWYADVEVMAVADGARVSVGQVIAHARPGVRTLPAFTDPAGARRLRAATAGTRRRARKRASRRSASGLAGPKRLLPAQIVFVEPPARAVAEPLPTVSPTVPPRRLVKLVPAAPPPPEASVVPTIVRTVLQVGVVALLIALAVALNRPSAPAAQKARKGKKATG